MIQIDLSQYSETARLDLCRAFFSLMDDAMQTSEGRAIIERHEAEIKAERKGGDTNDQGIPDPLPRLHPRSS